MRYAVSTYVKSNFSREMSILLELDSNDIELVHGQANNKKIV